MTITVYSKPNCPQCELTKRDMDILGIEYQTIDISQNQDKLNELVQMGFRSAPVVQTDSETWAGYDQAKIKNLVTYA